VDDETVAAVLRQAGQRVTRPRVAVLSCLLRVGDRHVSAEEVFELVSAVETTAHRATVYRTLESLTRLGVLRHVHLDRGLTAYHTVTAPGRTPDDRHLHAQCSQCGRVVDLPAAVLGDTARRVHAASGFLLDASHVALSGLCDQCANPTG
jgi:Fur family ferric uptake transcriptional regulator